MSPQPRPASVPSGILIHPAVSSHRLAENGGGFCAPFGGRDQMGLHLTQRGLGRGAYIRTKWHYDPFSCMATVDMGLKDRAEGAAVPLWGTNTNKNLYSAKFVDRTRQRRWWS